MTNDTPAAQKIDTALDLDTHFPAATEEQWRVEAESQLRGAPWEKVLQTRTLEGITLDPIYHPQAIGHCLGGSRKPWVILQPIAAADAKEYSLALNSALANGQNGIVLNIDGGVVSTPADLRSALDGVLLDAAPLFLRTSTNGPVAVIAVAELAKAAGISLEAISGGVLFDPVGNAASSGEVPANLDGIMAAVAVVTKQLADTSSTFRTVAVDCARYADAGANAVDELGLALATGAYYIRQLGANGLSASAAAAALTLEVGLGANFFMEIAKIRALRILWRGMTEAFGGSGAAALPYIIGRSTRCNKSSLDAPTNILRSTTEALSGTLGGCAAIELVPFEGGRTPSARASRLARNTQIILQQECPLLEVEDPTAGSWFIESVTTELCQKAWSRFQELEAAGGILAALRSGSVQQAITASAKERCKQVAQRRTVMVGVNRFTDAGENPVAEEAAETATAPQPAAAKLSSTQLADFLSGTEHSLPREQSFSAVSAALGLLPGSGEAIAKLVPLRLAEPYEQLRAAVATLPKQARTVNILHGMLPKDHLLRAEFTTEYFAAGGFTPVDCVTQDPAAEPLGDLPVAEAGIVVLCADDTLYPDWVPAVCKALKSANPQVMIVLAGDPGKNAESYAAAGLDCSFSIRSSHLDVMLQCLDAMRKTSR